jgi:hypothetical protein
MRRARFTYVTERLAVTPSRARKDVERVSARVVDEVAALKRWLIAPDIAWTTRRRVSQTESIR